MKKQLTYELYADGENIILIVGNEQYHLNDFIIYQFNISHHGLFDSGNIFDIDLDLKAKKQMVVQSIDNEFKYELKKTFREYNYYERKTKHKLIGDMK